MAFISIVKVPGSTSKLAKQSHSLSSKANGSLFKSFNNPHSVFSGKSNVQNIHVLFFGSY